MSGIWKQRQLNATKAAAIEAISSVAMVASDHELGGKGVVNFADPATRLRLKGLQSDATEALVDEAQEIARGPHS